MDNRYRVATCRGARPGTRGGDSGRFAAGNNTKGQHPKGQKRPKDQNDLNYLRATTGRNPTA